MEKLWWAVILLLALEASMGTTAQSISLAGVQFPEPSHGSEAEERSWTGGRTRENGVGEKGVVAREEYNNGGWSIGGEDADDIYNGKETPWAIQISGSESEHRNIFAADRVRWTPTRSRFQPARRPELEDELPLQEHQRRLQQDKDRRPGFRPGTQLENLGGGILMDEDDEEDDEDEDDDVVNYPPPRKLSPQRRPQNVNGGKPYPFNDLKSLLKSSGPSSLSEVLQQKNLSLEDFLRGSRNALSAITSSLDKQTENLQQRFRRPVFSPPSTRPPVIRRRPSTPTTTSTTTTVPPTTVQRTTTTTPKPSSSGDPSRDILELIWQDDDGPSLAEILSSRNMTVEDLIEQKQRAAGREDITELFGDVADEEKKKENKKGEETRNYAHFDILETDWNQNHYGDDEGPEETELSEGDQEVTQTRTMYHVVSSVDGTTAPRTAETRIPLPQLRTLSENTHEKEIPTVQPTTTEESKKSILQENISTNTGKPLIRNHVEEPGMAHPSERLSEDILYQEAHRPIIRTRLTTPSTSDEGKWEETQVSTNLKTVPEPHLKVVDHVHEESASHEGLPMAVKSAIIASGCLLGIAMIIFLGIFIAFRYRQWKRRGGASPYFCVAMLEAAAGEKDKDLKKLKKTSSKDSGWTDSIDSAQARLWRTLRRGRCRFYDRQGGRM